MFFSVNSRSSQKRREESLPSINAYIATQPQYPASEPRFSLITSIPPSTSLSPSGPALPSPHRRWRRRPRPPRTNHHPRQVLIQLRARARHLPRKDIPEPAKGRHLALHKLVLAAHELDELARVDVGVAAVLDVGDELAGDLRVVEQGGVGLRELVNVVEGRGELSQLQGEDVAGGLLLLGGVGGGGGQARGRRRAVGEGGCCGVRVVGVDLDHGFVEDLDYLLELACGEGGVSRGWMEGWAEGAEAYALPCCGLVLWAP